MTRTFLALIAAGLLVAGCGDDPSGEPTRAAESSAGTQTKGSEPDDSPTTSGAEDICDVITDEAATAWAGTPQRVSEALDLPGMTTCKSIVAAGDGLSLEWYFQGPTSRIRSWPNLEEQSDLEQKDLQLTGGVRAAQFDTEDYVGDGPYVKVVTKVANAYAAS
jgi:hypothetical protein